jgi:hypothetical protein
MADMYVDNNTLNFYDAYGLILASNCVDGIEEPSSFEEERI